MKDFMNSHKKRGLITSSTFFEVSPNTHNPKRVKAHARWREHPYFTLGLFLILAIFRRTRIKADASSYMF